MKASAALLALLAGCHDELAIDLAIPDQDDERLVEDAAEMLGIAGVRFEGGRGSVQVAVLRLCDPRVNGLCLNGGNDADPCERSIVAAQDRRSIAHELGHALGLDHVSDPENVMHEVAGDVVTDEQADAVADEVAWLGTWCP